MQIGRHGMFFYPAIWGKNYQAGFVDNQNQPRRTRLVVSSNQNLYVQKRRKKMRNISTRCCFEYKKKRTKELITSPYVL
jgi:hypothetical protein